MFDFGSNPGGLDDSWFCARELISDSQPLQIVPEQNVGSSHDEGDQGYGNAVGHELEEGDLPARPLAHTRHDYIS